MVIKVGGLEETLIYQQLNRGWNIVSEFGMEYCLSKSSDVQENNLSTV